MDKPFTVTMTISVFVEKEEEAIEEAHRLMRQEPELVEYEVIEEQTSI